MPKFNYVVISLEAQAAIDEFVAGFGGDGWKIVGFDDLPAGLPEGLRKKCDSAVVVVSGSAGTRAFAVWNNLRYDERAGEIDQHPFAVMLVSGSTVPTASIVDHGNWQDRSTHASPEFVQHVQASGIGNYFLANPPTATASGSLDELEGGIRDAFAQGVQSLKVTVGD